MVVSLQEGADTDAVKRQLAARGQWIDAVERDARGAILLVLAPHSAAVAVAELRQIPGVAGVSAPASPHPKVSAQGPVVEVAGVRFGGPELVLLSGPCSVESEEQIFSLARRLSSMGVSFLRGGAFKPRTSPYAFQGHGEVALGWMRHAANAHGLRVVTEVLREADAPVVAEHADLLQIGSRNMQNFELLKAVGRTQRPALLKRGASATIQEWLLAAEYLLTHGASGVILCERGIRGFDPSTRNLLDLGAVALLARVYQLPVVVDPSHGTGRRDLILPLSLAAQAVGAAGVMIETHEDPGCALSDGPQALLPEELREVLSALAKARR